MKFCEGVSYGRVRLIRIWCGSGYVSGQFWPNGDNGAIDSGMDSVCLLHMLLISLVVRSTGSSNRVIARVVVGALHAACRTPLPHHKCCIAIAERCHNAYGLMQLDAGIEALACASTLYVYVYVTAHQLNSRQAYGNICVIEHRLPVGLGSWNFVSMVLLADLAE